MPERTFSQRLGLLGSEVAMLPRDELPAHARAAIVEFAAPYLTPETLRKHLFDLLLIVPAHRPAMTGDRIVAEIKEHLLGASWYEVLDYIEDLHARLAVSGYRHQAPEFRRKVNRYFEKHG